MSDLYVYECAGVLKDSNGLVAQVAGKEITTQKIASSASAARSSAFNSSTKFVLLKADADVHFKFGGSTVDATTSDFYLTSGETLAFAVEDNTNVSVIDK